MRTWLLGIKKVLSESFSCRHPLVQVARVFLGRDPHPWPGLASKMRRELVLSAAFHNAEELISTKSFTNWLHSTWCRGVAGLSVMQPVRWLLPLWLRRRE